MLLNPSQYEEYGLDPADKALPRKLRSIESRIRAHTNNPFQVRAIRVEAAVLNGELMDAHQHMKVGDTVQISASDVNDGLYVIEEIDRGARKTKFDLELLDSDFNRATLVRYPEDVIEGAVGILEYEASRPVKKAGVASESLSRHSVSYDTSGNAQSGLFAGYPLRVTGFMKPYMRPWF